MKLVITITVEIRGTQYTEILTKLDQLDQKYKNLINVMWESKTWSEEPEEDGRPAAAKEVEQRKIMVEAPQADEFARGHPGEDTLPIYINVDSSFDSED